MKGIEVFFIKSLEDSFIETTKQSFFKSVKNIDLFQIKEVKDLNKNLERFVVLNKILKQRDRNKDLLIVSDDIIFTDGWFDNLIENINYGDLIGFSMAKPDKNRLSNRGFNLVKIGEKITYEPNSRGAFFSSTHEQGFVECDAVTGCCMFIKKEVLKSGIFFKREGANRWEELIFALEAKNKGFKVICLNHILWHYGISTKNKDIKLSSISYLIERKLWDNVLKKYGNIMSSMAKKEMKIILSEKLREILEKDTKKLIIGAGTVADYILSNSKFKNVDIASGLKEEEGVSFHGVKIKYLKNVSKKELAEYRYIIFTAIGYEDILLSNLDPELKKKIIFLRKIIGNDELRILIRNL